MFFVGEEDGWNFIVFEFIDGVNIRDLVEQRGTLSLELAIDYTIQVAEALEHAAQRDVVHRDIKPSNVLVTDDGSVKLVDMGLARFHQMEAGHSDLTASGVTLGTFDYISPEQASDPRRADVRSDLYSLGCTLFFMLTGRPPFPQGTVLQKLLAHSGESPPDPRELRPDVPDELCKILNCLLAKRPEQRYKRAGELVGELLMLRDRLGFAIGPGGSRRGEYQHTIQWQQRLISWAIPLTVLLMVAIGWELYVSGGHGDADQLPAFRAPQSDEAAVIPTTDSDGAQDERVDSTRGHSAGGPRESLPAGAEAGASGASDARRAAGRGFAQWRRRRADQQQANREPGLANRR